MQCHYDGNVVYPIFVAACCDGQNYFYVLICHTTAVIIRYLLHSFPYILIIFTNFIFHSIFDLLAVSVANRQI